MLSAPVDPLWASTGAATSAVNAVLMWAHACANTSGSVNDWRARCTTSSKVRSCSAAASSVSAPATWAKAPAASAGPSASPTAAIVSSVV